MSERPNQGSTAGIRFGGHRGFSLVELLVVMGIIVLLMALLVPAMSGWTGTAGRRGAVNVVMNTLEQARVAALESGRDVYVVFWRPEFPYQDAIMVLREAEGNAAELDQLTRWMRLPKGVLLHRPQVGRNIFHPQIVLPEAVANALNGLPGENIDSNEVAVIRFNPSGRIVHPGAEDSLIILSEGVRGTGGTEALISERRQAGAGFEIITLSRPTGRAQLVVSQIPDAGGG